jgi:hypothetical protein
MGAALSTQRTVCSGLHRAGVYARGLCVSVKHGLLIVSDTLSNELHMYSMTHGSHVRSVGRKGSGKVQLSDQWGLCTTPDGDGVLVAEYHNNRVQEMRIVDGTWVRFVGVGVLGKPMHVDCNADVIVVAGTCYDRVSVMSWADGSMRAQFGSYGNAPGQLNYPCGVRLLRGGNGLVVADRMNNRLCVYSLRGEVMQLINTAECKWNLPFDVLVCHVDDGFIVTCKGERNNVAKFSREGLHTGTHYTYASSSNHQDIVGAALAALPNDGCVVLDGGNKCVQLVHCYARSTWMRACSTALAPCMSDTMPT